MAILMNDAAHMERLRLRKIRDAREHATKLTNDQLALARGIYVDAKGIVRFDGKDRRHSKSALSGQVNNPKSMRNGSTRMVVVR